MNAVLRWLLAPLYRFRWYRWRLYQRRLKAKPRKQIENVVTIYAHEFGSDADGNGTSVATAYRTFARAVCDIPTNFPPGMQYTVDVTGLGWEAIPTDYNVFASEEAERREREIQRIQKLLDGKAKEGS